MNQDDQNLKKQNEELSKHLEQASLSTLVLSISSTALVYMGLEPQMKEKKNLKLVQFNIDLLDVLKNKTESHRTADETELINKCTQDLKLAFIEAQKQS